MFKYKSCIFLFICLLIFISILTLNINSPLYADDWVYSGIYGLKDYTPLNNVFDIIKSQYNHYFQWGGRSIVHTIDQLLLMVDFQVASIVKSFVFLVLILYIYLISNISNSKFNYILMVTLLLFIYLFPITFNETILWTTGAANYLFGTCIILIFIYPYCLFYLKKSDLFRNNLFLNFIFFIGGIIAGWTNENTVFAVLFGIFILFLYIYFLKKTKIPRWMIYGFCGMILGFSIMILAPGNAIRANYVYGELTHTKSYYDIIIRNFNNVLNYYLYDRKIQCLILLYIIIFTFTSLLNKKEESKKKYLSIMFFIMANITLIVMTISPIFPSRATFSSVVFFTISNGILLSKRLTLSENFKPSLYLFFIFCIILLSVKYRRIYDKSVYVNKIFEQREVIIQNNLKKNNYNIVLEPIYIPINFFYEDFSQDPNHWLNKAYSKRYGLQSIMVVNKK